MSLNRLSLRSKIALIVALMLVPIGILTYQVIVLTQSEVGASRADLAVTGVWTAASGNIYVMLAIAGAVLLVALGLATLIGWQTTRSFARMINTMDRVRQNDFTVEVEGTGRKDEVGQIARAVEVFKDNGLKVAELTANYRGQVDAIRRAQLVAEFSLDGIFLDVNENYLSLMGVARNEVIGQHHSTTVDLAVRQSAEYRVFWDRLAHGEHIAAAAKRTTKSGEEIWVQGTYNPILGLDGKPYKVVAYATDVTQQKMASANLEGQIAAIGKAQAVIEFGLDGKVLTANANFLDAVGYSLSDIVGQHHSIFVDPAYRQTADYRMFWEKLGRGEYDAGQYKRIGRGGKEIWLQASYNPIMDMNGKPFKVVKYATDITEQKLANANFAGQLAAIGKAQAVIEFGLDGKVLTANQNFLDAVGYSLSEIVGQHHSMFVDPAYRLTADYRLFWEKLGRGEYDAGQYKRIGRGGKEIWLQASYNPIMDMNGKPFKVVKYATDITEQMLANANFAGQLAAIGKAQAVIEFGLDGKVLTANANFLDAVGYSLSDVVGQHHSMFVDPAYRQTADYRMFWEKLGRGEYDAGQYKRIGRGGKEIWLQASYNPIMDMNGKPFKVVKYATDITEQVKAAHILQLAVKETQDVVASAKANDLTRRIPLDGKTGEIAELCTGINGLLETMTTVISEMLAASSTISSAVAEITTGTNDLSERTEKQASSLEETSSSMEEIATTIRQNAENAQQANQLAINARSVASEGGQVVSHAVDAMSKIESSSRKISDIIGVIDEIAFQTNLLALNAAVEAARAGDAGRGFAVVASEVRSLAQRSSEAAKDIKALIVESGGQVKDGVKLVNDAGSSLHQIVDSVKRVTDIVSEIASASKEQAIGVEEINKAVAQMDEMTQQNSALVEENAAACRMLQQQAEDMSQRMSTFEVGDARYDVASKPVVELAHRRPPQPQREAKTAKAPVKKVANSRAPQRMQADLKAAFESDTEWKEF
ncbi:MAG: PAS domain S-box protein [Ancalomicrobiaceae bacterium]|nr:PAS domain S-box protein [Ancalomicrobiaceae bacterium]